MTCRGYDPKSVNVPKAIKRRASRILDNSQRKAFIRGFVKVLESELRSKGRDKK
jgi:hypothetical protein